MNYVVDGGDVDTSLTFIEQARAMGMPVGAAGSGSSHHVERFTDQEREAYCVLTIDKELYTPPHKRMWTVPPGQGSVFSDEYFRIHLKHYTEQLDMGATILQRDEGWMAISQGYDFNPKAVAAFREYLAENSTAAERAEWGIGDPVSFDIAEYFRNLDPPVDAGHRWFRGWIPDDPVKEIYDQFIVDGVVDFHQRLRAALNDHAGRPVPFSCNNTSLQQWTPAHLQFDWAMSELMFRTANPEHLYDRYRVGLGHGKVQVLSTPKPVGYVEDHEAFRILNRQVIAQAYSLGGLCKAPWDLYLQAPDGRARYFGDPGDYADLYGFVRGMAPYLEGFEEAAAYGAGIEDVHGWQTHPVRIEGNDDIYAFLRVRPRDAGSPVVIHCVNWSEDLKNHASWDLYIRKDAIAWENSDDSVVLVKKPVGYNEKLHRLADRRAEALRLPEQLRGPEQAEAYSILIDAMPVDPDTAEGGWLRISDLRADPWTVVVIEPL
ncbi:MAG: hypothetical protein JJU00_17090 [Opitutales bacterium]|nr:hypothetical protein [Opitutales bacterium]